MIDINEIEFDKIKLFAGISEENLNLIKKNIRLRNLEKNTVIIKEQSEAEQVYIILSGIVKLYKSYSDDEEVLIHLKGKYDIVGHLGIFNTGRYYISIETVTDAILATVPTEVIEKQILDDPIFARNIIMQLCERIYTSEEKVKELSREDSYSRVARELIRFEEYYKENFENNKTFNIAVSRKEFASLTGLSREMVSRVLSRFNDEGIIEVSGKEIRMVDREKLESWII